MLTSFVQTSCVSGELSPRLFGRTDIEQYAHGCQSLTNMVVHRHGGASKRSGTRYVASTKSDGEVVLVRFAFDEDQQYVLEFGDQYIRFFRYQSGVPGQLLDGGSPTEIPTPYTASQIDDLDFTQSADTLVITHRSHAPRLLQRTGAVDSLSASWSLTEAAITDGPYDRINTSATTLTPSAVSGSSVTITASSATFSSSDIGRWIRIRHSATWGWAKITAFTSATQVTASVSGSFGATTASADWRLGSWHSRDGGNWPSTCAFHQGRLWFANTKTYVSRVWSSNIDDYYLMSPSKADGTVLAENGITVDMDSGEVQTVNWMVSDSYGLLVLCGGAEGAILPSGNDGLSPTTTIVKWQSSYGSGSKCRPMRASHSIFFWQTARKLREMSFSFEADKMIGPDMAILAEHLPSQDIVDAAYQEIDLSVIWSIRADGVLLGCTIDKTQRVVGWHKHNTLGGFFERCCCIRSGGYDTLWVVVRRTIGGNVKRYIEVMQRAFDHETAHEDAWFVDCALEYDSTPVSSVSGASHLNGLTVTGIADTCTIPDAVVSAGSVNLPSSASHVIIGLRIASQCSPMPVFPPATRTQDPRGSRLRIPSVQLQLWRSIGGELYDQADPSSIVSITERLPESDGDAAPALFTGIVDLNVGFGWSRSVSAVVSHDDPQPFSILAMMFEVSIGA